MKHELSNKAVTGTQYVSRMGLACGEENAFGLHAQFLELEDGSVCALFDTIEEHQSYPGRVHGGIVATILDEVLGRVIKIREPEIFGVTIELTIKYRAPVPLGVPLRAIARLDKFTARIAETSGEIVLDDGTVAAQGFARYLRVPLEKIVSGGLPTEEWHEDTRPCPASVLA